MEPSTTFIKRSGTTDVGKDYEDLLVVYLSLKYFTDPKIKSFFLASNNNDFGSFDDVIIEIDDCQRLALQLKHVKNSEKASLPTKLGAVSGDFSLTKYLKDFEKLKNKDFTFALFTNYKFLVPDNGLSIKLLEGNVEVKAVRSRALDIFGVEGNCFEFESSQPHSVDFFKKFRLFANEPNVNEVEASIVNEFKDSFGQVELVQYVKFIQQWSKREGNKTKLDRSFLEKALPVHMLTKSIKSYKTSSPKTSKLRKILHRVIQKFDVTVVNEDCSKSARRVFADFDDDLGSMSEINGVIRQYYLSGEIEDFRKLDAETKAKVLWLEEKYPLIVSGERTVYEVIKLCRKGHFIVLCDWVDNQQLGRSKVLRMLSDLEADDIEYRELLTHLSCQLKNDERISLKELLRLDPQIKDIITVNHLLQMMEGTFKMGDVVNLLVMSNPALNQLYQEGYTPIHIACLLNNLQLVKLIAQSDMDVGLADKDGNTPLYLSCAKNLPKITYILLDLPVDVNIANKDGNTPLIEAVRNKDYESTLKIIELGGNVNITTKEGDTLLQMAASEGDELLVKELLRAKTNIDARNKDGLTALFLAAQNGFDKIVQLLALSKADLNVANKNGETALFVAAAKGHSQVVYNLINAQAELNVSNGEANTALHMAYLNGHKDIVDVLIQYGAKETIGNVNGLIPSQMRPK